MKTNSLRATATRQPATREPSLASRLGPAGECQAQGRAATTTLAGIKVRRDHEIEKARAEAERQWTKVSQDLQQRIADAERQCERETRRWWAGASQ